MVGRKSSGNGRKMSKTAKGEKGKIKMRRPFGFILPFAILILFLTGFGMLLTNNFDSPKTLGIVNIFVAFTAQYFSNSR